MTSLSILVCSALVKNWTTLHHRIDFPEIKNETCDIFKTRVTVEIKK